uniref:Uncharacterized protein n=1 Tax=viral metagenome TaxID=1070528 RepID=A0A6M3JTB4_9ZZZZ
MLKQEKVRDPYADMRRTNPPPDFPFRCKKVYNRSKAKEEAEEILKEELLLEEENRLKDQLCI